MRRRIRLTGRRQLSRSVVDVKLFVAGPESDKKFVTMKILKPQVFSKWEQTARIKLRLFENKMSETLNFGTIGKQVIDVEITNPAFSAPTCQLRVVSTAESTKGRLLGSTDTWTLRTVEEDTIREGILLFQTHDISPRTWKLDIREEDYPIVYIDKTIPNSRSWVQNDPTFTSCVLPAIIREIFDDIFSENDEPEQQWQQDWVRWADALMPGKEPPWNELPALQREWISNLLDNFCEDHDMLGVLIKELMQEAKG